MVSVHRGISGNCCSLYVQGWKLSAIEFLRLVDIQYERNDMNFVRGTFRVRGDVVEIFPASRDEHCIRVEFFGDEIDRIREVDALTGEIIGEREHVAIFQPPTS